MLEYKVLQNDVCHTIVQEVDLLQRGRSAKDDDEEAASSFPSLPAAQPIASTCAAAVVASNTNQTKILHGPIRLIELNAFIGDSFSKVMNMYKKQLEQQQQQQQGDKVTGFYTDKEKPFKGQRRIFYLQKLSFGDVDGNIDEVVCHLFQPSQPRMVT